VIDFQKGRYVVSLKTIDPRKYKSKSIGTNQVINYLHQLDRKITVNGKIAYKTVTIQLTGSYFFYIHSL
jgi:hypothetical protein